MRHLGTPETPETPESAEPPRPVARRTARIAAGVLAGALALALAACGGDRAAEPGDQKTPSDPAKTAEHALKESTKKNLPEAAKLLEAATAALGGAAPIEAIASYYAESQISVDGLGLEGTARTWWRGGDFYVETEMPGVGLVRLGNQGGEIWSDDPIHGMRTITGVEAEQAAWSTSRSLVHDWAQFFKEAETTAIVPGPTGDLAEITLTSPSGDAVVLRLDLATKMPVSQSFKQANPMGAMPVTVTFMDFREVAGTKIAYHQEVDASLTKMTSKTTRFEVNAEVPSERFARPGPPVIRLPEEAGERPPAEAAKSP